MPLVTHTIRTVGHPLLFFMVNGDLAWEQARTPKRELALARAWLELQFREQLFARSKGESGAPRWTMEWRLYAVANTGAQSRNEKGEYPMEAVDSLRYGYEKSRMAYGLSFKKVTEAWQVSHCLSEHGIPYAEYEGWQGFYLRHHHTKFYRSDRLHTGSKIEGNSPEEDMQRFLAHTPHSALMEELRMANAHERWYSGKHRARSLKSLQQRAKTYNWAAALLNANFKIQ